MLEEILAKSVRVVHYINQSMAGIGGEEQSTRPVEVHEGAVGSSRALQVALGDSGTVVATISCGDDYAVEDSKAQEDIRAALEELRPDMALAGPAFEAGRYGVACADFCRVAKELGIPAVTGMHIENAGLVGDRRDVLAVPTGTTPTNMVPDLKKMVALGMKLVRGEELGTAADEGYVPRGVRIIKRTEKTGLERALDMLRLRVEDRPFTSEIPLSEQRYEHVTAAPPMPDLSGAKIAFVVSAGIVPMGNPDGLPGGHSQDIYRYPIDGVDELEVGTWMSAHGGFNTTTLNTVDPNYALPLRTMRELERQGVIKSIHPYIYSTVGAGTAVSKAQEMGAKVAAELKEAGVDGVLEVST